MQFALQPNVIDCSFQLFSFPPMNQRAFHPKINENLQHSKRFFSLAKNQKKSSMNGSREDEPKWRSNDKERKQIFDTFVWPRDQTMATYSPVHGEDLPSRPLSCCYRPVKWRSATFWALPLASRLVTFTENTALCVAVLLAKCSFTRLGLCFRHSLTLSRRTFGSKFLQCLPFKWRATLHQRRERLNPPVQHARRSSIR